MAPRIDSLLAILASGAAMSAVALVGAVALLAPEATLTRWVKPMVALASGTLFGGALFHMMPHAIASSGGGLSPFVGIAVGFSAFLALDQLLHWHHCHRLPSEHTAPLTWLLLLADGLHNLLGGMAIGAMFLVDLRAGWAGWLAAVMHEVPQELGDFGVLVHGGWSPRRALAFNFLSALTFLLGGVAVWSIGARVEVEALVAVGAGNFLYIAAADLVPEFRTTQQLSRGVERFFGFVAGLVAMGAARVWLGAP